jgi:hypothetical protein
MSRHQLLPNNPRFEVFVGWDPPLQTFFVQVYDREGAEEDQPFVWLGASGRIGFEELVRGVSPYAPISLQMAELLSEDRSANR